MKPRSSTSTIKPAALPKKKVEHEGPKANKSYGQHFLSDQKALASIVALASQPEQAVHWVEIGPGRGALSRPLISTLRIEPQNWSGIELDPRMCHYLKSDSDLKAFPWVEENALHVDFQALQKSRGIPLRIVGNLPYNVGTGILIHLLLGNFIWDRMVFMFQKEVGETICAEAGSSKRNKLSVLCEFFCQTRELAFILPPAAFDPAPRVDSAVVLLEPRPNVDHKRWLQATPLLKEAFLHRRKRLFKNLKSRFDASYLLNLGLDPDVRAQSLTLKEWIQLIETPSF